MRFIEKGPAPAALAEWNEEDVWWRVYDSLSTAHKKAIRESLAREQRYLCGYCGFRIDEQDGDCHIEHVITQEECKASGLKHLLTYYGNMLGSCMGRQLDAQAPWHCGAFRQSKPIGVTPYQPDCGNYFVFTREGDIDASRDPSKTSVAKQTIQNLGLDVRRLKAARAEAIRFALEPLADASPADFAAAAAQCDIPDAKGRLDPFCFAVRQVLLRYA